MSRTHLTLVVFTIAIVAVVFYGSRGTSSSAKSPGAGEDATATFVAAVHKAKPADTAARDARPTEAETDPRKRSLATMRGAVARAVKPCTRSISGDPVRVFVSSTATVDNGAIRTSAIEVKTSAPTPAEFTSCITRALGALAIPAADGDTGSFSAHVSLLASATP